MTLSSTSLLCLNFISPGNKWREQNSAPSALRSSFVLTAFLPPATPEKCRLVCALRPVDEWCRFRTTIRCQTSGLRVHRVYVCLYGHRVSDLIAWPDQLISNRTYFDWNKDPGPVWAVTRLQWLDYSSLSFRSTEPEEMYMLVVKGASGSHTHVKEKKIPHPQLASSQLNCSHLKEKMQLVFFFPPAGDLIYIRKHVLGSILKKQKKTRQIKVYESFRLKIEISGSSLKHTKNPSLFSCQWTHHARIICGCFLFILTFF